MSLRKRIDILTRGLIPHTDLLREKDVDPDLVDRLVEALTGTGPDVDVLEVIRDKTGESHD